MKQIVYAFSLIQLLCTSLHAQQSDLRPSSLSIANTSVCDTRNWMAFVNPALIAFRNTAEVGVQYENRYNLHELSTKSIQLLIPSKWINTGASFSYFGFPLYHFTLSGLGVARNYGNKFAIGLQLDYYSLYSVATNAYHKAFLLQGGMALRLSPEFCLGFHTFNALQKSIQGSYVQMKLPAMFSIGTEYSLSGVFIWRTQFDHELSSYYRPATGFDYYVSKQIQIKAGAYYINNFIPCLGFSVAIKKLKLGFTTEIHPLLGLNTFASLHYTFGNNKSGL